MFKKIESKSFSSLPEIAVVNVSLKAGFLHTGLLKASQRKRLKDTNWPSPFDRLWSQTQTQSAVLFLKRPRPRCFSSSLILYSQYKSRTPGLNTKSSDDTFFCFCVVLLCYVNNTRFPFPQQLSQLPQSTESEAGGWGGESYKEIRESLTSLGRSMGCFTRKMEEDKSHWSLIHSHTPREVGDLCCGPLWRATLPTSGCHVGPCWRWDPDCCGGRCWASTLDSWMLVLWSRWCVLWSRSNDWAAFRFRSWHYVITNRLIGCFWPFVLDSKSFLCCFNTKHLICL